MAIFQGSTPCRYILHSTSLRQAAATALHAFGTCELAQTSSSSRVTLALSQMSKCQEADPQVITSSLDSTVRLWDLAAGKSMGVLTHHKKGVRALAVHPKEFTFASASAHSIKQWRCPKGEFMQNFEGHNAIINSVSLSTKTTSCSVAVIMAAYLILGLEDRSSISADGERGTAGQSGSGGRSDE